MDHVSKVRFTRHATTKFQILKSYGFEVSEQQVIDVVLNPARVDKKNGQFLAVKPFDSIHALRVVYEVREDFLIVITFYPVRRERYGV